MHLKTFDIPAVLLVLILAAGCMIPVFAGHSGGSLIITAGGSEYTLPLSDGSYPIVSDGITLTLEISDGAAGVSHADCPDGLCAAMPAIRRAGESIVCVPGKIVIRVAGESEAVDGIAG